MATEIVEGKARMEQSSHDDVSQCDMLKQDAISGMRKQQPSRNKAAAVNTFVMSISDHEPSIIMQNTTAQKKAQ